MSDQGKFYWLKLQERFFDDLRIKRLRKLAGGDTLTIIYLKLQLATLRNGGVLQFRGLDSSIYEELALEIDEDADNIEITINYLKRVGLAEFYDDKVFLPDVVQNTGKEGSSAQRMREMRARLQNPLPCLPQDFGENPL